jgi:hypothetical protein
MWKLVGFLFCFVFSHPELSLGPERFHTWGWGDWTTRNSNNAFCHWVIKGCKMANMLVIALCVPWLRRLVADLSPRRHGFAPRSVRVGLVVDKVSLRWVSLRIRFSLSISFHCVPPHSQIYITCGMNNRPVGDRSSEIISPRRHVQQQK